MQAGHDALVIGWGKKNNAFKQAGVKVIELARFKLPERYSGILLRWKLYRTLRDLALKGEIDIVEVPDCYGWLPFRFNYCPVIARLHLSYVLISHYAGGRCGRQINYFERKTLKNSKCWVGVSKFALLETEKLFEMKPQREEIIYNPVTLPEYDSTPANIVNGRYILYAGTISDRKGAYTLAKAASILLDKYKDLSVVYAGATDNTYIEGKIRGIVGPNNADRVIFTGWLSRPEVMNLMSNATVFVFPSKLETFGLVIAEAMLNGIPVVCCNSGPCTEFVENGKTGELVEVDNDSEVIMAVSRILDDSDYASKLAVNGQQFIRDNFCITKNLSQNLALYQSLLGEVLT